MMMITGNLLDELKKELELARTEIIAQRAELVRIAAMVQQVQMEMTGIREMIEDRSQH